MTIRFDLALPPFADPPLNAIHSVSEAVFGESDLARIRWRMPDATVFRASVDDTLVGFKAGYAMSATKYYSWLGGVLADYRRGGLASKLMVQQHDWLRGQGYLLFETASNQENTAMAAVNLKHGFLIAGTRRYPGNTQILFLKELSRAESG